MPSGTCSFCGEESANIEEHHVNRHVDSDTTIPLCPECHQSRIKPLAHKAANINENVDWHVDGLAFCELGNRFTNITHRVTVKHGFCMDAPFCWANDCPYNKSLDVDLAIDLTDSIVESFFREKESDEVKTGRMRLTDEEGDYWFEKEDVIQRLIALIEDENKRQAFLRWYETVDTSISDSQKQLSRQQRLDDFEYHMDG